MPAVTTTAGKETNTMECTVDRETTMKAPATESSVETNAMKIVMMKEPEAEH